MIWLVWAAAIFVAASFGLVLFNGAPYLPTMRRAANDALDMLDLKKGQLLVELGSGDGIMLKLAAQRGLRVVGYELNPLLVLVSRLRTRRYRQQVKIVWGNFWRADLSTADGVFVFLLDKYMAKLDGKLKALAKGGELKVVSHAFRIPGRRPEKKIGAMFLYKY